MTATSPLLDERRTMPSNRLESAAANIGKILQDRRAQRSAMINATAGTLSGTAGDALEAALAECETLTEARP